MNFNHQNEQDGAHWKPMIGFILCIILTAFSLWVAFYSTYSPKSLLLVIAAFAFVQAVIQLFQVKQITQ